MEIAQNESMAQMIVIDWLTGHFSNRGKALSVYKRGMGKAKKHDHQGAIDDYTTTIGMPDTVSRLPFTGCMNSIGRLAADLATAFGYIFYIVIGKLTVSTAKSHFSFD